MTALLAPRFLLGAVGAAGAALVAVLAATMLPQLGLKGLAGLMAFAGAIALVLVTGRPKEVFLAGYVISLTYSRQYFGIFVDLFGTPGTEGVYWTPADLMLLCLLGVAATEAALGRGEAGQRGHDFAIAPAAPFLLAALLTTLAAERPDLAMTDTVRVLKFVILLAWLHRTMTRAMWVTLLLAFAASIAIQTGVGLMQVVLRADAGLSTLVGGGQATPAEEIRFNRARGLMGHPNVMASYLLMLVPAFFGLAVFARHPLLRAAALVVVVVGMAGMLITKSRAPGLLLLLTLPAIGVAAVMLRAVSARAALGAALLALPVLGAAMLPFAGAIVARFTEDFGASLDFRAEYNRAAMLVFDESPIFGIGFGASGARMLDLVPLIAMELRALMDAAASANARSAAPVHNLYLLILAEAGLIGLATFVLLLGGTLLRGLRAIALTGGAVRGVAVGLTVGLLAQAAQQTIDFSLWLDTGWYSLAIILALLGTAPRLWSAAPR